MNDISKYELKEWPKPPAKICTNSINRSLGIVSPSLMFHYNVSNCIDPEVVLYKINVLKYKLYRRTLKKWEYRRLVRIIKEIEQDETINPTEYLKDLKNLTFKFK
jgi:hypothetical protein